MSLVEQERTKLRTFLDRVLNSCKHIIAEGVVSGYADQLIAHGLTMLALRELTIDDLVS